MADFTISAEYLQLVRSLVRLQQYKSKRGQKDLSQLIGLVSETREALRSVSGEKDEEKLSSLLETLVKGLEAKNVTTGNQK